MVVLLVILLACLARAQSSDNATEQYSEDTLLSVTFRDPSKESNNGTYCTFDPEGAADNFNIQITSAPNDTICFGPGSLFQNGTNFPYVPTQQNNALTYKITGAQYFNSSADYSQLRFRQGENVTTKQEAMMGDLVFQVYRSEDCSDEVGRSSSWIWSCDNAEPTCDTVPYRMRSFSVRMRTNEEQQDDRPGTCASGSWENAGVALDMRDRWILFVIAAVQLVVLL
ncbi:hypothetical protein Slin15195_G022180 [Septoria linicola]|uniref:Uncharacterized protein n=1 Tax=Septoria linicola TaxID=215465 RepID=A0A9Q9EGG4_9PEZI|nr:hypothetical protein Slin14017_G021210 [Septoria linicola]USW48899.1 hypothetical protein Slin15195_G022180 [Septoria linicola]